MNVIRINEKDNVCVALTDIKKNDQIMIDGEHITVYCDISAGHKIAIKDISKGELVIKYGEPIGKAFEDIKKGEHVHIHNLRTRLDENVDYKYEPVISNGEMTDTVNRNGSFLDESKEAYTKTDLPNTFMGYLRADGKVGIRNEIWIIPTVGCVSNVASKLASLGKEFLTDEVNDVIAFTHPYGCSQMGDDQENTREVLADMIHHPNAAGVLVLGLGCENCNIDVLKPYIGEYDSDRIKFLVCQESEDEINDGLSIIKELINMAKKDKRQPLPVSKLIVGLKCGGSDGLSGITANPLVGKFSDLLISKGGTTILTEVPEMFGAETLLMNRCASEDLFEKTVTLINDFKDYFTSHGQTVYENPSPGNKKGGISTLEDKSLGCTQKSGSTLVKGVLKYAETVTTPGLNLLSAPGNDLVASSALAFSGAQLVLFTTGRGTPFSCPVPTMKISSNSKLFEHKSSWIDFNAGRALDDNISLEDLAKEFYLYVISVAEGEKVSAEKAGYRDMAIFKQGVTL